MMGQIFLQKKGMERAAREREVRETFLFIISFQTLMEEIAS